MNYSATSHHLLSYVLRFTQLSSSELFIYLFTQHNTFTSISWNYCVPWTVSGTESAYKQRGLSVKLFLIFSQSLFHYYFQSWVQILFTELFRVYFLSDTISNISSRLTCHFEREWALLLLLYIFFLSLSGKRK